MPVSRVPDLPGALYWRTTRVHPSQLLLFAYLTPEIHTFLYSLLCFAPHDHKYADLAHIAILLHRPFSPLNNEGLILIIDAWALSKLFLSFRTFKTAS